VTLRSLTILPDLENCLFGETLHPMCGIAGTYLSGGLDSSILRALVKKHHINDLTTFSVGFSDARFDERDYQRQMVAHLRTDRRQAEVDGADIWPRVCRCGVVLRTADDADGPCAAFEAG
jgi:asparagine synthetase B (glutamine-hydrolysing)